MTQCEMCKEVGKSDCENCYLGNPCYCCSDYDDITMKCTSEGACGNDTESTL